MTELRWNGASEGIAGEIDGSKGGEVGEEGRDGAGQVHGGEIEGYDRAGGGMATSDASPIVEGLVKGSPVGEQSVVIVSNGRFELQELLLLIIQRMGENGD